MWVWSSWVGCGLINDLESSIETNTGLSSFETLSVRLHLRPGIRNLVAQVEGVDAPVFQWKVNGSIWPVTDDNIPASDVWPGQHWEVEVSDGLGRTGYGEVVIPHPAETNVLVVLLDDVGVDKLAPYDPAVVPVPTPNIDALAAEGVVFDYAYAAPLCGPTRANLLTGRHARRTGFGALIDIAEKLALAEVTIPEMLVAARGEGRWSSAALGKWNIAGRDVRRDHPNLQGFQHYSGLFTYMTETQDPLNDFYDWEKTVDGEDIGRSTVYNTTDIVNDTIEQIATLPEPWFLYVALNAAHKPFHVPPAGLATRAVTEKSSDPELQRADLEAADTEIGRLLASFTTEQRARTTILLTADNGTQSDAVEPPYLTDRAKRTVYDGGVRVPLIVRSPLVTSPGAHSDALVHLVDVFATVADLAGVPLLDQADGSLGLPIDGGALRAIDSVSLVPYLLDPTTPSQRNVVLVEQFAPNGPPPYSNNEIAIRTATHMLVQIDGVDELYERVPGAIDEGPNLLADEVTAEESALRDELSALLEAEIQARPYDDVWK